MSNNLFGTKSRFNKMKGSKRTHLLANTCRNIIRKLNKSTEEKLGRYIINRMKASQCIQDIFKAAGV